MNGKDIFQGIGKRRSTTLRKQESCVSHNTAHSLNAPLRRLLVSLFRRSFWNQEIAETMHDKRRVSLFGDPQGSKRGLFCPLLSGRQCMQVAVPTGKNLIQVPHNTILICDCPKLSRMVLLSNQVCRVNLNSKEPMNPVSPDNPYEHRLRECTKNRGFFAVTPKSDPCSCRKMSFIAPEITGRLRSLSERMNFVLRAGAAVETLKGGAQS